MLTYLGDRHGLPVLTLLLALAMLFSNWNENHEIPAVQAGLDPALRPSVGEALAAWKDANCVGDGCGPMVMVATAGSGIRAAYWTTALLGRLHDTNPEFDRRTVAISGVSGGSVGRAAVYRAMIAGSDGASRPCGTEAAARLAYWAKEHGRFVSFRMCRPSAEAPEPPLGWALSETARRTVEGYLGATSCPGEAAALINLQRWLNG